MMKIKEKSLMLINQVTSSFILNNKINILNNKINIMILISKI